MLDDNLGHPPPADTDDDALALYAAALREKSPDDVARELPGLVDVVAQAPDADVAEYLVGVSFSKKQALLDYTVDRVLAGNGDNPIVETVKPPVSERHRYVHFAHPPDPYFDASALRARLVATVERERQEADDDGPESRFADLWEQL